MLFGQPFPPERRGRRCTHRRSPLQIWWAPVILCASIAVLLLVIFLWHPWRAQKTVWEDTSSKQAHAVQESIGREDSVQEKDSKNSVPDVQVPEWVTANLLPVNEYSRPGTPLTKVNGVVVHYVGNPGTTAEQNRSFYASLAETQETWASSHFVIGIDGTIIQCVPLNEVAYCSNNRNEDTISIECCHPDDTGEFTQETQDSLEDLLNWLISTYGLGREDILRHYDVTGKECPRYYVTHPDSWEELLDSLTFS